MEKVMILGSGGREHALGWSIAQHPEVSEVIYADGNAGTGADEKCRNIEWKKKENLEELAGIVEKEGICKIVVGPEQPLVGGIVDFFNGRGFYDIFGPTSSASMLEADKFCSYDIMNALHVSQADSVKCYSTEEAVKAIKEMATEDGIVIKARGLTGGKGVTVCDSAEHALAEITGHAQDYGQDVLIAERLFSQEFSVFGISDGERVVPLEMSVQDHKRLLDGDCGPNTGGMGAYGPAPFADAEMVRRVTENIMTPVVQKMKAEGREYKGFLYAGMIKAEEGPKVIEFNVRFGDPEAQPSVMMLKNGLYQPIASALEGKLDEINIGFRPGAAVCVVMASNGYPGKYDKGLPIWGLEEAAKVEGVKIFHAGTAIKDGKIVTAGGRVLGVTAYSRLGIADAKYKAYEAVYIIEEATTRLNNKRIFIYRTDIADKAWR